MNTQKVLLGALLELTDSQQAALYAAFKVADREGLLLLDLKDLKALLGHLKDNPQVLGEDAALFTSTSAQALLRRLASLEQQGAEALFGEPALQLEDLLHPDRDGRGRVHLLDASRLVHEAPKVYATFLLWLLAELFEQLPERGDADKPLLASELELWLAEQPQWFREAEANSRLLGDLQALEQLPAAGRDAALREQLGPEAADRLHQLAESQQGFEQQLAGYLAEIRPLPAEARVSQQPEILARWFEPGQWRRVEALTRLTLGEQ